MEDQWFLVQLKDRYEELRSGQFSNATICDLIENYESILSESQTRNFQRWPVIGDWVWPNSFIGNSYGEEIDFLKDWVINRMEWLDNQIPLLIKPDVPPTNDILIFPNPTTENFTLVLPAGRNYSDLELRLFNSLGQQLISYRLEGAVHNIDINESKFKGLLHYDLLNGDERLGQGSILNLD